MRLRPFTPNSPIEDINADSLPYFEDPDALNEQDLFDSHIPTPIIEQPQQIVPDQYQFEELHADHGIISYERQSIEPDHTNPLPEGQAETREQLPDNTSISSSETINNGHSTIERPSVPSRQ